MRRKSKSSDGSLGARHRAPPATHLGPAVLIHDANGVTLPRAPRPASAAALATKPAKASCVTDSVARGSAASSNVALERSPSRVPASSPRFAGDPKALNLPHSASTAGLRPLPDAQQRRSSASRGRPLGRSHSHRYMAHSVVNARGIAMSAELKAARLQDLLLAILQARRA